MCNTLYWRVFNLAIFTEFAKIAKLKNSPNFPAIRYLLGRWLSPHLLGWWLSIYLCIIHTFQYISYIFIFSTVVISRLVEAIFLLDRQERIARIAHCKKLAFYSHDIILGHLLPHCACPQCVLHVQ